MRAMTVVVAAMAVSCGNGASLLTPRPVSPAAVQKTCALVVSCLANPPISPAGECVAQFELGLASGIGILFGGPSADDLERFVNCGAGAGDCASALDCASTHHGAAWCAAHPASACDGDVVVSCNNGWGLYQTDCAKSGLHCREANGAAACTDGNTCVPQTPATCDGNRYVSCDSVTGLQRSTDCGAYAGLSCQVVTSGTSRSVGCMPNNGACQAGAQSCDGTAALFCAGTQLRIDCGQFASHCALDGGKVNCVTDASDCTSSSPDRCNGDALEMCVNGRWQSTACASLGLATCVSDTRGVRCM